MIGPSSPYVRSLRRALLANALFSSLCALVFLAVSGPLAEWTGAARADIVSTGVSLVVFVGLLGLAATRPAPLARWATGLAVAIAAMDVLWVLTTPLKVAPYAPAGQALFAAIAVVVAAFAWLQIRALFGIRHERQASTAVASA